jgi:hypothetical protein
LAVAHEYAVRLALIAFATASIQGIATRADFEPALKLALSAAAAAFVVGWLCGEMARRIVEESVQPAAGREEPSPAPASAPQAKGR